MRQVHACGGACTSLPHPRLGVAPALNVSVDANHAARVSASARLRTAAQPVTVQGTQHASGGKRASSPLARVWLLARETRESLSAQCRARAYGEGGHSLT